MIEIEPAGEIDDAEDRVNQPPPDGGWIRRILESYFGKVGAIVAAALVVVTGVGGCIGGTHLYRNGVDADLANVTGQVNDKLQWVDDKLNGFDDRLDEVELDMREVQTVMLHQARIVRRTSE